MLLVDGVAKCNGHLSQFAGNRAFQISHCWISWLLLR